MMVKAKGLTNKYESYETSSKETPSCVSMTLGGSVNRTFQEIKPFCY